jgi:hypothetical protein
MQHPDRLFQYQVFPALDVVPAVGYGFHGRDADTFFAVAFSVAVFSKVIRKRVNR